MQKTLVIGANGQIGSELVDELSRQRGADQVIAADIGACSVSGRPCRRWPGAATAASFRNCPGAWAMPCRRTPRPPFSTKCARSRLPCAPG